MVATNMAAPPEGRVYEVWVVPKGADAPRADERALHPARRRLGRGGDPRRRTTSRRCWSATSRPAAPIRRRATSSCWPSCPKEAISAGSVRRRMAVCYRHPNRETGVSCSNCGNPICPDCMTATPVGMRCPDCSRQKTPGADDAQHLRRADGDVHADRHQRAAVPRHLDVGRRHELGLHRPRDARIGVVPGRADRGRRRRGLPARDRRVPARPEQPAPHPLQHVHPVLGRHDARAGARACALRGAVLRVAARRLVRRAGGVAALADGRRVRRRVRLDGRGVHLPARSRRGPVAVGPRAGDPLQPGAAVPVPEPEHLDRRACRRPDRRRDRRAGDRVARPAAPRRSVPGAGLRGGRRGVRGRRDQRPAQDDLAHRGRRLPGAGRGAGCGRAARGRRSAAAPGARTARRHPRRRCGARRATRARRRNVSASASARSAS